MYYISKRSDVNCAMIDISKAYDRVDTSLVCNRVRENGLPGQAISLIEFMGKNTFLCTSYGGQLSNERNVKNRVLQGN